MLLPSKKVLGASLLEGLLLILIVLIVIGSIVFFVLKSDYFLKNTNTVTVKANDQVNNIFTRINIPADHYEQIILNLDNNKPLQIKDISNHVFFSFDNQKKIATEWPVGNAGFLVKSYDGESVELVGYNYQKTNKSNAIDGYDALLDLDLNGDFSLNQTDANYPYLYVWVDLNQNGVIDKGELFSLKELGITSIDINSLVKTKESISNSTIVRKGYFLRADGSKGEIAEVDLFQDPYYRQFLTVIPLSENAKKIPNVIGSGDVRDLQEAATKNPELFSEAVEYFSTDSVARRYNMMNNLLFEWTKKTQVSLESNLIKLSTSSFQIKLVNLVPLKYNEITSDSQRLINHLIMIEKFTGKKQLHIFSKEIRNSTTQQVELHLAVSFGDQIIMQKVVQGNKDNSQKNVIISGDMFSFSAQQKLNINEQYEIIKKTLYNKLQEAVQDNKQNVTLSKMSPTWMDSNLQQQIDAGQYSKKKYQPVDYPRRRHLSECIKPNNIIDQQVRDCAAGKISKTW